MRHYTYTPGLASYAVCILVTSIKANDIQAEYLTPFGIDPADVIVVTIHQALGKKKTPASEIKEYLKSEIEPLLLDLGVQYVVVTDSDYFKQVAKVIKTDANLGYVVDSVFGSCKAVYAPNYKAIFYDPIKIRPKIAQAMTALVDHASGTYDDPGNSIISFAEYPTTDSAIAVWLGKLIEMNKPLTVDIEAFSLKHHSAGIATITFCWSKTEGVAFPIDYEEIIGATEAPYGNQKRNDIRRDMLRSFFNKFKEKLIYHNISYDVYVLIYQLYMSELLDTEGLLTGLDVMLSNWDDTKLITYLATNSCAGNKLGLKEQAQEYAGNYAQDDIKDITKIKLNDLLKYNLVDGLSTWFVHEKWYDKMVADDQLNIYETLFKPAIKDIIQMQLTGLPVNINRVTEVKALLEHDETVALATMKSSPVVLEFTNQLNAQWVIDKNESYKKKRVTIADANEEFNPNSGVQLQSLLYGLLELPTINVTESKQPSTDGDTLKALINHTTNPDHITFLKALIDFKLVNKINTGFIPVMESSVLGSDGWHYLFGGFNLGGTVSGRLSSSAPNLQTLPANSKYAKLIKSCIQAKVGWLFVGLDFSSLEDKISALTTKDKNKLLVYEQGYDGHCLRAYAYFGDQMPDIINTVDSINSIQTKYKELRQTSKAPSFALTYLGTYITLMKNCGFTEEQAKSIEKRYHDLYVDSDLWVEEKLNQASKAGYVTAAFGLRVRTPLLHQVVRNNSKTPFQAQAEGRTAANALGQSYCALNTRAGSEFMGKVRNSPYRLAIKPCAQIHDAQYMLVKDDLDVILYVNEHLVKAVQWQDDPAIAHPTVKLGGELSIFWPTWKDEVGIPNYASVDQVLKITQEHLSKYS